MGLKQLIIVYNDGTKYTKIVPSHKSTIKPIRDGIRHCDCSPFKYKVEKHRYLCVSIVKFGNKHFIYPQNIPCIPETTLDDIEVIDTDKPKEVIEKPQRKQWSFESSSGDGYYQVTDNMGKLKCNCMGFFRSKDRRCKHIKEVEKELGITK
jgi:hypothetical protein